MKTRLIINASNIHQGGGKSLLLALLDAAPSSINVLVLADRRLAIKNKLSDNITIKYIRPRLIDRIFSEIWMLKNVTPEDLVLCFGNLPPLFKLKGRVVLFIQNLYMGKKISIKNFNFYVKLRILFERFWLYNNIKHSDEIIVQSLTVESTLDLQDCTDVKVTVMPFVETKPQFSFNAKEVSELSTKNSKKFLYVAYGDPHKNHKALVDAWCLLAHEGFFPSLKLTIDAVQYSDLYTWINQRKAEFNLNIDNVGVLIKEEVAKLYNDSDALIYPSYFESFGLPLYEAKQAGLPILASEMDYVRDAVDPEYTFNPNSARSIARSVKRFLNIEEKRAPLCSPGDFLCYVLDGKVP